MNSLFFQKDRVGELHISCRTASLPQPIKDSLSSIEAVRFAFRGLDYAYHNEFPLEKWQQTPFFFEWEPIEIFFEVSSNNAFRLPFEVEINGQSTNLSVNNTESGQRLSGKISLGNAVGFSEIKVIDARGEEVFALFMEVFPQKLDYKEDFHDMVSDISDIVYNLAFDYLKKSYAFARPKHSKNIGLNEWLAILNQLFEYLEKSIDHILRKPSSRVIQENRVKPVEKIKRFHPRSYKWISQNRKYLKQKGSKGLYLDGDLSITHLPDAQKHLSHDTHANRFVKWAIEQIISQIQELSIQLQQQARDKKRIAKELEMLSSYKSRLQQRLKSAVLADVKDLQHERGQSNVINMSPAYRDFYHRFLLLRRGLYLHDSEIFRLDYKDIATLYEYWCFLTLVQSLSKITGFEIEEQNLIGIEHHQLRLRLKKGKASVVQLTSAKGDVIKVYYNKALSADTFTQIPDNLVEFYKVGYQQPFRILLDAKYRLDRGSNGYPGSKVKYGPPLDAISQLHRYRDAILFSEKDISPTKTAVEKVMGGVIVFPFPSAENDFIEHPFYLSIEKTNIGALPLLPGLKSKNYLFKNYLAEIFEASPETLYEQQVEYKKSEYHLLLSKLAKKVWIFKIESKNRQQQLDLIFNQRIYVYPYSDSQELKIHQQDSILIYDEELHIICGYGQISSLIFQLKNDIEELNLSFEADPHKYLVFQLENMTPCVLSIPRHDELKLPYTNQYALSLALELEDSIFLWMKHYEEVKAWKELARISDDLSLTISHRRESESPHLVFSFTYKNHKLQGYFSPERKWCFLRGKKEIILAIEQREHMKKILEKNFKKLTS